MGLLAVRLGARLTEMRSCHNQEHEALTTELTELQSDLTALIRDTDQLIEDLGDTD